MRLPRWFHLLGSPPFVYGFAGKLDAVARRGGVPVARDRRVLGTRRRADGSRAGRGLSDPLYPSADRVRRHDGVRRHGGGRRHRLHLADQARARGGGHARRRSARRSPRARSRPAPSGGGRRGERSGSGAIRGSCPRRCCCSCSWAISRCAPHSRTATRRTESARSSPWSASSTSRSFTTRWCGGTPCIRARRS